MSNTEIYKKLADWLKGSWYGLPDSEHLISVLEATYTPQEAEFLTGMPFSPKKLYDLAAVKGIEKGKLGRELDKLAKKGLVYREKRGEEVFYRLNDAFFVFLRSSFWPGYEDDRSKEIAPPVNRYMADSLFKRYEHVHVRGLRAVPINGTVDEHHTVMPYEDVVKLVDGFNYYSVSYCACRQRKKLDPDSPTCKLPMENCLHFDNLGRYIVENGLGREITKEETLKILTEAAESGLVHGASNWREQVDTICNCCKCCCMWLESYHVFKHKEAHTPSNYRLKTHAETCKGCGLCVKRCPMEALELEETPEAKNKVGKVSVLSKPDLCLGCGVCAYKCPTKSLKLVERETIHEPPKDARECTKLFYIQGGAGNKPK